MRESYIYFFGCKSILSQNAHIPLPRSVPVGTRLCRGDWGVGVVYAKVYTVKGFYIEIEELE